MRNDQETRKETEQLLLKPTGGRECGDEQETHTEVDHSYEELKISWKKNLTRISG